MSMDPEAENQQVRKAQQDASAKEAFLAANEQHILKLTAHILHQQMIHQQLTKSDDEWSVALSAVSQAIDSYQMDKGDFWGYAAIVIKSRVTDWCRSQKHASSEILIRPGAFEGEVREDDPDFALCRQVSEKTAVTQDADLRDEIEALGKELSEYGFSFFDLADCSPRTAKTREGCKDIIRAIFLPPPLTTAIRKQKCLPVKEILKRVRISGKMIDRHRKYLIATAVILDGDYPGLSEYVAFLKPEEKKQNKMERKGQA